MNAHEHSCEHGHHGHRDAHGEVAVYFEAAATIMALVLLGQVLELRARQRTGTAIIALGQAENASSRRPAKA